MIGRKSEWAGQEHSLHVFAKWFSQAWWRNMKRMMITPPTIIPASKENLKLPNQPPRHPSIIPNNGFDYVSAVIRL